MAQKGAAITRHGCPCAGGIWLQESSENELGERRSDTEARSFVCRKQRE